jgi:hypothetical protein
VRRNATRRESRLHERIQVLEEANIDLLSRLEQSKSKTTDAEEDLLSHKDTQPRRIYTLDEANTDLHSNLVIDTEADALVEEGIDAAMQFLQE